MCRTPVFHACGAPATRIQWRLLGPPRRASAVGAASDHQSGARSPPPTPSAGQARRVTSARRATTPNGGGVASLLAQIIDVRQREALTFSAQPVGKPVFSICSFSTTARSTCGCVTDHLTQRIDHHSDVVEWLCPSERQVENPTGFRMINKVESTDTTSSTDTKSRFCIPAARPLYSTNSLT